MLSLDIPPTRRRAAAFAPAPAGVGGALAAAARRCLERLPNHLLRAMVTGLRANADDLAPGTLFRRRDAGGCAVGVTLRELAPDAFRFGRLEFWLWHRWRRGVEADVARRFPQLQQLEQLFDNAVAAVEDAHPDEQPAKAVGLWLAASGEAELRARDSALRARHQLAHDNAAVDHGAETETSSCS